LAFTIQTINSTIALKYNIERIFIKPAQAPNSSRTEEPVALDIETRSRLIQHLRESLYSTRGPNERRHQLGYLESWIKKAVGGYESDARKKDDPSIKRDWDDYDKAAKEYFELVEKEDAEGERKWTL
jgi:hypothetical protein